MINGGKTEYLPYHATWGRKTHDMPVLHRLLKPLEHVRPCLSIPDINNTVIYARPTYSHKRKRGGGKGGAKRNHVWFGGGTNIINERKLTGGGHRNGVGEGITPDGSKHRLRDDAVSPTVAPTGIDGSRGGGSDSGTVEAVKSEAKESIWIAMRRSCAGFWMAVVDHARALFFYTLCAETSTKPPDVACSV
ncbi:hypothetical protein BJV74DRAFT_796487 [Russula compacta]|nr:hypothetical protein BJV74DRAFT_796487 [Russula compacta]